LTVLVIAIPPAAKWYYTRIIGQSTLLTHERQGKNKNNYCDLSPY
jgi:hypothetical protein